MEKIRFLHSILIYKVCRLKKGHEEPSHNMQLATDTQSKLICAVHISQHPTDHHELPPTMNKALENLPTKSHKVSADTIYKQ